MNHKRHHSTTKTSNASAPKKKAIFLAAIAVSRFRSALAAAVTRHQVRPPRVFGTLYGRRRGHLHLSFQLEAQMQPAALLELQTPTNELVREMATSGLMRIALECDRGGAGRLMDEPMWRVYCNGLRCGYAVRRECRPEDWKVLRAVEPVSVGAGVLPAGAAGCGEEGDEVMYMRAMFERVVGSGDSEAFYMMSPDGHAGPELCVYLLRV
ncbi:protein MIZU-KUSSEI 1-like isoform X2 [Phalaenopsis equestris]|nr:protein MIZU-KUSSEI 1-like isoform X2 [Phalaenopsis equestris]